VSFAARIALAITGAVAVALVVVAVAGGTQVRRSYLGALRGSLEARVDAMAQARAAATARTLEDMTRLARSPRMVSVVGAGDAESIGQTAVDELRGAIERLGPGTGFLVAGGFEVIAAMPGAEERLLAPMAAGSADTDGAASGVRVVDDAPYDVLRVPIEDVVEEVRIGTLVVWSPVRLPDPLVLPDGTRVQGAILADGTLFGGALDEPARATACTAFASGAPEAEVDGASGTPLLVLRRPIAGSVPAASMVAIADLAALRAAVGALLGRAALAGVAALVVGLVAAMLLGRGLSRPVARMGEAAARIERGDFAVRRPAEGAGELATLERRLNDMAAGLAMREQYRRVLDAVADPEVAAELMAGALDLGGRTQEVGILFCDIRGFTTLTERMDPADVITMVNEHMTLLTEVAYAHGGTIDKFVGDLIMVTFGAPKTGTDDAQRMVRCAHAMVAARARANAGASRPIEIGVGCAFGPVVAGCMGSERRLDYTVLGARVNLAARLCSKAPAMRVLVDGEARRRAGWGTYAALAPLEAKGFSGLVEAFELVMQEDPACA
jgi:class 3 adenylate cyclase